jgi:V-type H+-transporting ATPase subunit e
MGASWVPVLLFSAIWGVVGLVLPFVVPRGPHKSVIQVKVIIFSMKPGIFVAILRSLELVTFLN